MAGLADRIVTIAAATSAPVLTLLVDTGVIGATVATDLGAIVAAAVASYHSGQAVGKRKERQRQAAGGA